MVIGICIGIIVNTIDGPTKLVPQDAILGGLSIGQFDQTQQEWFLGGPLPKLFKWF